jgi:hypothetical protein
MNPANDCEMTSVVQTCRQLLAVKSFVGPKLITSNGKSRSMA